MSAVQASHPPPSGPTTSAEQVAAVLAAATEDLIVATDPTGRVTVFNAGAERMLGYTADEVFSIVDDGPGISAQDQARIFERIYRAESAGDRHAKGSGPGLPIARALVELHGGRIWVESACGRGATFNVSLPLDGTSPPMEES